MADLIPAGAGAAGPIRIPEWQDIIHLRPRETLTAADRRNWNTWMDANQLREMRVPALRDRITPADRAGLEAAGINPAKLDVLLRGRQVYQDMHQSQIPEWRQKMLRVLTALDNVQDQVATVLWVTDPITRRWAPTRILSDIVHKTNSSINSMEQALAGPAAYRALAKSKAARGNKRSSRAATGKVGIIQRAAGWLKKSQGHLLEAGQALDTWAGVGISLGAIFGAMEEAQDRLTISAYEAAKFAVAGAGRTFTTPGSALDEILADQQAANVQRVRETGAPVVAQFAGWVRKAIAGVQPFGFLGVMLNAAAQLQRDNDTYTRAEHALALYHSATLSPLMGQVLAQLTDPAIAERIPELDPATPRVADTYSRDLLIEAGATLNSRGEPTGDWQHPTCSLHHHIDQLIDESTRARSTWLPQECDTDECALLHSLVEAHREGASWILAGNADALRVIPDPETRAEMFAYHLDAMPPAGTTRAQLDAWMRDQVAAINQAPDAYDWRTWRDVTNRHWPTSL